MNFKTIDIFVEKKKVAKVFRYVKTKHKGIKFFTPNSQNFQVGLMCHKKNHLITPHIHKNHKKIIKDMTEMLIVFSGKLKVFFYGNKKNILKSTILRKKDMILLISGAHGFKVLEKLEMLEIKQGPFISNKDKIKFKAK